MDNADPLRREHCALMREYGRVQIRCSELLRAQAAEIQRLEAERMRLRGSVMARDTALAWAREDSAALEAVVPVPARDGPRPEDLRALEASLVAADLVICQAGCLSQGDYWRVQDHCRRTGKACVVVAQPGEVRIIRIGKPVQGDAA